MENENKLKEKFKSAEKSYKQNNIGFFRNFCLWFAKKITLSIINKKYDETDNLCHLSALLREEVEYEKSVNRSLEFYFGYMFAYENIARRLSEEKKLREAFKKNIKDDENFLNVLKYIDKNNFVNMKDIAKDLNIDYDKLFKYLNQLEIKDLNIISINGIGRTCFCSLTTRGRDYMSNMEI